MKPVGADPDEGIHLIQIWCGDRGESGRCPPSGADAQTQLVPFRFVSGMNCSVCNYNYWADASCQNIENESQLVETRILRYGHHPAPFKNLQSLIMAGSPDTSTFLARQFSVLIAALCIGISVLTARRNYLKIWLFLMILANPFVLSLVASVNPSSWTISSAIGAGILIIGLSLDDFRSGSPVVRLILLIPISLIGLVAAFSRPEIQTLMKAVVLVSGLRLLVKLVVGTKSQLIRLSLITLGLALTIIGLDRQIREWRGYLNFPEVSSSWGGLLLLRENIFSAPRFALASLLGTPQGGYATALTPSVHFYLLGGSNCNAIARRQKHFADVSTGQVNSASTAFLLWCCASNSSDCRPAFRQCHSTALFHTSCGCSRCDSSSVNTAEHLQIYGSTRNWCSCV